MDVSLGMEAQLKENILGRAKRHSRYRTVLHVYKENIPHEEVFRVMQIL